MRAGKYNDDVEILLGFNEEEGHMVTSIFEAFPLLYSAMAAGWPVLGSPVAPLWHPKRLEPHPGNGRAPRCHRRLGRIGDRFLKPHAYKGDGSSSSRVTSWTGKSHGSNLMWS